MIEKAIARAGEYLKIKVPLEGEGKGWEELEGNALNPTQQSVFASGSFLLYNTQHASDYERKERSIMYPVLIGSRALNYWNPNRKISAST